MGERIAVHNRGSEFSGMPKAGPMSMTGGNRRIRRNSLMLDYQILDLVLLFLREIRIRLSSISEMCPGPTGSWIAVRE